MSSLKTLLTVVMLGAVSYGVYVTITRSPQTPAPTDEAPAWGNPPTASLPGEGVAAAQFPGGSAISGGAAPSGVAAGGMMPSGAAPAFALGSPVAAGSVGIGPAAATAGPGIGPQFVLPQIPPVPVDVQSPGAAAPYTASPYPSGSGGYAGATSQVATSQGSLPGAGANGYETAMQAIRAKLDLNQFAEAHLELSRLLYNTNQVPPEKKQEVLDLLDQLAGTVIYSREHLLEVPYVVRSGDTIEQIAQSYNVPWQLLANINGIHDPRGLQAGQELKVVRGPFDALVSLDGYEMTLMLAGRYAGRFAIGVGIDHTQLEGSYVVSNQTTDPQYYAPDQTMVDAGDPSNPLGEFWIGLGQQPGQPSPIGIHGTGDPQNLHRTGGPGSIRLSDRDIRDAFGILSIGSRVVVQR